MPLTERKSAQISKAVLSILADIKRAEVSIVSVLPPFSTATFQDIIIIIIIIIIIVVVAVVFVVIVVNSIFFVCFVVIFQHVKIPPRPPNQKFL